MSLAVELPAPRPGEVGGVLDPGQHPSLVGGEEGFLTGLGQEHTGLAGCGRTVLRGQSPSPEQLDDDLINDQWSELLNEVEGERRSIVRIAVQGPDRRVEARRDEGGCAFSEQDRVAVGECGVDDIERWLRKR